MWGSGALRQAIFEYGGLVGGTFKATTGILYLSYFIVSCGESDTVATVHHHRHPYCSCCLVLVADLVVYVLLTVG